MFLAGVYGALLTTTEATHILMSHNTGVVLGLCGNPIYWRY